MASCNTHSILISILLLFVWHIIIISSKNVTQKTHKYITNLTELLLDSAENKDDIIYGNPLLLSECRNALLYEHKSNLNDILHNRGFATPWFWSRETLDATIKQETLHRRLKITHALQPYPQFIAPWSSKLSNEYSSRYKKLPAHVTRWYDRLSSTTNINNKYIDDYKSFNDKILNQNSNLYQSSLSLNVFYYHIEKSGSSSIGSGILRYFGYNSSYISENMISNTNCGFTFVREPISRFISAYYTVNRLIYFHNSDPIKAKYHHDTLFNWWNITGEPQRITQFVDDLIQFGYKFVVESPLEHIMTQTGILSISQNNIHFIGRLNKLKQHWNKLYHFCDNELLNDFPEREFVRMKNYGLKGIKDHQQYAKMMDLHTHKDGDLLPAYKAVADSYDLYNKIANYYKQDFVCFGFKHDFKAFRNKVYKQWKEMMAKKQGTN